MENNPRKLILKDEYNTVIYLQPGDDAAAVKKFYEDKIKNCYSVREESESTFNNKELANGNLFN